MCTEVVNNLFGTDPSDKIEKLNNNIKSQIETNLTKNISKRVKAYQNLKRYVFHLDDERLKKAIHALFLQYINNLDSTKDAFLNNFQDTYGEKVFELVMAFFIDKNFSLKDFENREYKDPSRKSLPDLEFKANEKTYFLECTTRDSTLIPDYIDLLPNIDCYFSVAKIFFEKNEEFKKERKGWSCEWWYESIWQEIWQSLDNDKKNFIWGKLGFSDNPPVEIQVTHFDKFKQWIFYNQYVLCNFPQLLPSTLLEKLEKISLSASFSDNNNSEFYKVLARFVAQGIVSKLSKEYFLKDIPVVVSISLSLLNDLRMIKAAKKIFDGILSYLPNVFKIVIREELNRCDSIEKYNELLEKLKIGLNNLYGIIIDTTWYNWFPDIAGAQMPDGYYNCFAVIYNSNISEHIQNNSDKNIFDRYVPYNAILGFEID